MKEPWKQRNSLLNKPSKSTDITFIKDGNTEIREKRELSKILNSFFYSVGEELAKDIDETSKPLFSGGYTINESNAIVEFQEVNDMHIRDAISKIKKHQRGLGRIIFLVIF